MKRIFKYVLEPVESQFVCLPLYSKVLSAESQFDDIVLYVLVDDSTSAKTPVNIVVKGTGHDANDLDGLKFLNTVKLRDGALMFHVFCSTLET